MRPVYKCRVCGAYTEEPIHCGKPALMLMDGHRRLRLSKLVSALLRHIPWEAGIRLDERGWVSISELVKGIRERWRNRSLYQWVTEEHIVALALLDPKGRFQLSLDRKMIRAAYGHSIRVELGYKPLSPSEMPPVLLHGTTADKLKSILSQGLKPGRRIMVHLTPYIEDAVETARRHGSNVVVLEVDSQCLARNGVPVYRASNHVYLAPHVPPKCIRRVLRPSARM